VRRNKAGCQDLIFREYQARVQTGERRHQSQRRRLIARQRSRNSAGRAIEPEALDFSLRGDAVLAAAQAEVNLPLEKDLLIRGEVVLIGRHR
jgi:hypothetical protein